MLKRCICLALLLIVCVFLGGCWDYRGLDQLVFVSGVAVDLDEASGSYKLTYEILDLSGDAKQTGLKAKVVESTGRTLSEAVRNANRRVVYRLYFGHTTIFIISEELALKGQLDILLDWLLRFSEVREIANVIISVGQPAGELLKIKGLDQSVIANEISKILQEDHKTASLSCDTKLYESYDQLHAPGMSVILPIFHIVENDKMLVVESNGAAAFKKNTMVGILSPLETKYLLFIVNEIDGGVLTCRLSDKAFFSLSIVDSHTNIDYEVDTNGTVTFDIKINVETLLNETFEAMDLLDDKNIKLFEKLAQEELKADISESVSRVQKEYGTDIYRLGSRIHATDYKLWKTLEENWDERFSRAIVNIEPEIKIINTGFAKS